MSETLHLHSQRLANTQNNEDLEAINICALLHRLGQIMFWCFPTNRSDALEVAYKHENAHIAERAILGFTLDKFTSELIKEWQLSDMLSKTLKSTPNKSTHAISDATKNPANTIGLDLSIAGDLENGWRYQKAYTKCRTWTKLFLRSWILRQDNKID